MGRVSMSDNRHSVNLEVPAGRARGLARTSSVQASTRLCTRAHPRARVHVPRARMHIDEQACMCLVHACTSTSRHACASCTHAYRRARMHVPRARMHVDEQACMCLVHACTSTSTHACASCTHAYIGEHVFMCLVHACTTASTYACASCTHAQRHACVQRHVHVCGVDVLACSPMCMRLRACAGFETGVHPCSFTAHVRFSVFAVRLPPTC